jgi:hypothetical protein
MTDRRMGNRNARDQILKTLLIEPKPIHTWEKPEGPLVSQRAFGNYFTNIRLYALTFFAILATVLAKVVI